MEASVALKAQKQQEFALASIAELASPSPSPPSSSPPVIARFGADSGVPELRIHRESEPVASVSVDLREAQVRFASFSDFCFGFRLI